MAKKKATKKKSAVTKTAKKKAVKKTAVEKKSIQKKAATKETAKKRLKKAAKVKAVSRTANSSRSPAGPGTELTEEVAMCFVSNPDACVIADYQIESPELLSRLFSKLDIRRESLLGAI